MVSHTTRDFSNFVHDGNAENIETILVDIHDDIEKQQSLKTITYMGGGSG